MQHYWRVREPDTGAVIEGIILADVLRERRRLGWASCPVVRVDVRSITQAALRDLRDVRRTG